MLRFFDVFSSKKKYQEKNEFRAKLYLPKANKSQNIRLESGNSEMKCQKPAKKQICHVKLLESGGEVCKAREEAAASDEDEDFEHIRMKRESLLDEKESI